MKRILALLCCLLLLCGCGRNPEPAESAAEDDTIQIGISFDSFVIERWQRDRDVFVSTARELGAEVLVQAAGGDLQEQIEQIRYFIQKGVDAIVVVAVDCSALGQVVQEARDAGIYVISYDRLIRNADLDFYISFDSRQVGVLMAEDLVKNVPKGGSLLCINGSASDYNVDLVQEGFRSVVDGSDLTVVRSDYCPNWEAEVAYNIMQDILDSGAEIDGIMCGNDDLASLVYKALSERGMTSEVCLVGQDADLAACQRIVSGWQSMTVYKPVENLARQAAEYTLELIRNGTLNTQDTMDNGWEEVPCVLLEPVAVTEENMESVIIEGGFHQQDEVYANRVAEK